MDKKINQLYVLYKEKYEELNHKNHYYVIVRIMILVIFMLLIIAGMKIPAIHSYLMIFMIVLLFVFMIVCKYHDRVKKAMNHYLLSLDVIEEYKKRMNNTWNDFDDLGDDLVVTDDYLYDLDIVGHNSLFQFLTIAKTIGGRKALINKLSNHKISQEEIKQQQEMILELTESLDFCILFQTLLKENNGIRGDLRQRVDSLDFPTSHHKIELCIHSILSLITLCLTLLSLFDMINGLFVIMMVLIQLSYALIIHGIFRDELNMIQAHSKSFSQFYKIMEMIEKYTFSSQGMKELSLSIHQGKEMIMKLNKVFDLDTFRYNFIGYIIGNGFFPLNSYILYAFHKEKVTSFNDLKESIKSFEELEALISLTMIGVCRKNVCMPIFDDKIQISFQGIKHPLLDEEKCIDNSFSCQDNIIIITGSNMSGKTSFMRTIGMNLILMYAGTFVEASFFKAPYFKILTSMRVSDDIDKGISTFYGELLRIKKMIDCQKEGMPMIIFIDEIFKGTNYNDRIFGAKKVIEKLGDDHTILFMTTHDFELCDIENSKIENYYFEEYYVDQQIKFDYKIKKGKCRTTNAKYLMKQIGIIE